MPDGFDSIDDGFGIDGFDDITGIDLADVASLGRIAGDIDVRYGDEDEADALAEYAARMLRRFAGFTGAPMDWGGPAFATA